MIEQRRKKHQPNQKPHSKYNILTMMRKVKILWVEITTTTLESEQITDTLEFEFSTPQNSLSRVRSTYKSFVCDSFKSMWFFPWRTKLEKWERETETLNWLWIVYISVGFAVRILMWCTVLKLFWDLTTDSMYQYVEFKNIVWRVVFMPFLCLFYTTNTFCEHLMAMRLIGHESHQKICLNQMEMR